MTATVRVGSVRVRYVRLGFGLGFGLGFRLGLEQVLSVDPGFELGLTVFVTSRRYR